MRRAFAPLLVLVACGAQPTRPLVSKNASSGDASARATVPDAGDVPDASRSLRLTQLGEVQLGASYGVPAEGPAFTPDGTRVGALVHSGDEGVPDKLALFDAVALGPIAVKGGTIAKAAGPLLVVGRHAFDPSTGAELVLPIPNQCGSCTWQCPWEADAFSQDGLRASTFCRSGMTNTPTASMWTAAAAARGKSFVTVYDTQAGARLGSFDAPPTDQVGSVHGVITPSGNFVLWTAGGPLLVWGALQEIKSHAMGPVMTLGEHSVVSADDRVVFTARNHRLAMPRNRDAGTSAGEALLGLVAAGRLLDATNGHTLMTIEGDVARGTFSPSSRLLAVYRRDDCWHCDEPTTLHAIDREGVLASIPCSEPINVAFSPDETHLATLSESNVLRLYKLEATGR